MQTSTTDHSHCWRTISRHDTSEGTIRYQRCTCGSHRVLADYTAETGQVALVGRSDATIADT